MKFLSVTEKKIKRGAPQDLKMKKLINDTDLRRPIRGSLATDLFIDEIQD